jgi:large subunit ribosomal protein L6
MSRIGRMPVQIPAGVDVKIEGNVLTVKGPGGVLTREFHKDITIQKEGGVINVTRPSDEKAHRSLHGLTRSLVFNMVAGVTKGYSKELEISGVGYRAAKQGNKLVLTIGYSHPVEVIEEPGITITVPAPNKIVVSGPDKQKVGQFAAELREKRPPEPYKGKGIRYADEIIHRKEGKAGKGAKK